jgi:hypothetical protein
MTNEQQAVQHTPEHESAQPTPEQQPMHPAPHVRRIRRRRKRGLKSRIKRALKSSGTDKKLYLVAAGIIAVLAALFFSDLLLMIFPKKMR